MSFKRLCYLFSVTYTPCFMIFQGMALAWQEHGGGLILALQLYFLMLVDCYWGLVFRKPGYVIS